MDCYTWNPGPGTYKPKVDLTTTTGATHKIAVRLKDKEKDYIPGPGTYNQDLRSDIVDRREPAFSIQGRNETSATAGIPAPGAYSPSISLTMRKEPQFTLGPRTDMYFEIKNPGPGTYNPRKIGHSSTFTLGKRFKAQIDFNLPGPGAYQRPHLNDDKSAFTFGKRFSAAQANQNPPPGTYNPRIPKIPWKKDGCSIGERHEFRLDHGYPGPGNYNDHYCGKPPAYTMGKRFVAKHDFIYPSPGEYNPVFIRGPSGFTLAAHASIEHDFGHPGPGAYNPTLPNRSGYSMASKLVGQLPYNNPGPGSYYNPKRDKYTGPAYSIGPRHNGDSSTGIPGPGSYSPFPVKGKGCVIATKLKDPNWSMKPGPGRYNLRSKGLQAGPTLTRGAAFTMAPRLVCKPRPGEKGYIEPPLKVL